MRRSASVAALVLAVLLGSVEGCSDRMGPGGTSGTPENSVGVIVSAPVHGPLGANATASAGVVFVSLPPGSVPTGVQASITNQTATGFPVMTVVVDGGFDPVPVAATVGDTLMVEITDAASTGAGRVRLGVTPVRPLKVVRTSPPSGGRDVPLNTTIVIVFSEPIDPATLTTDFIQLWRGATPVAGTVRFSDATQIQAEFLPDTPLASQTTYQLIVSQQVRNLAGVTLGSPIAVQFTTGTIAAGAPSLTFSTVSAGNGFVCGLGPTSLQQFPPLTPTGAAYCWGANRAGELGASTTEICPGPYQCSSTPVAVSGGRRFAAISAGDESACALTASGAAYCWGDNSGGELGNGTTTASATPVAVAGNLTFATISAGRYASTCGVTTGGAAYCWGLNDSLELGAPSSETCPFSVTPGTVGVPTPCSTTPIAVSGGLTFATVSLGGVFACGATPVGTVYCWGDNKFGELGNGTTTPSATPGLVVGGVRLAHLSAGWDNVCGVTASGSAYCWGDNNGNGGGGQLGNGTTTNSATPVPVAGGLTFSAVDLGQGDYACGITTSGAAYCWGNDDRGGLGDGAALGSGTPRLTPVAVVGGLTFSVVAVGGLHSVGVGSDHIAYTWGSNGFGQLGNGTWGLSSSSSVPVQVVGQP